MDTHITWALIIIFATLMYTIFDGFDLGVGILLPFFSNENERDTIVDTITPVWDGNESWIVLAGVGLFGGFPKSYATLLPALYLPLVIMIISLAFRGVSMEFRFLTKTRKKAWDIVFSAGSMLAAFCQGLILGNLLEGIQPRTINDQSTINPFYFLTPFTICTGFMVILLYVLIGGNWLNVKTGHVLQHKIKRFLPFAVLLVFIYSALLIVSRRNLSIFKPRFAFHSAYRGLFLPDAFWYLGAFLLLLAIFITIKSKKDWLPFAINMVLFAFTGVLVISHLWPFIVPPFINISDTGAPLYGNHVLLYGALIVIPVILSYLLYSYFVFKGKTTSRPDYDPVLKDDLKDLHHNGTATATITKPPVILGLVVRVILKVVWLILFFIILGFLGDYIALGIIAIGIILFCFYWYKNAVKSEQQAD